MALSSSPAERKFVEQTIATKGRVPSAQEWHDWRAKTGITGYENDINRAPKTVKGGTISYRDYLISIKGFTPEEAHFSITHGISASKQKIDQMMKLEQGKKVFNQLPKVSVSPKTISSKIKPTPFASRVSPNIKSKFGKASYGAAGKILDFERQKVQPAAQKAAEAFFPKARPSSIKYLKPVFELPMEFPFIVARGIAGAPALVEATVRNPKGMAQTVKGAATQQYIQMREEPYLAAEYLAIGTLMGKAGGKIIKTSYAKFTKIKGLSVSNQRALGLKMPSKSVGVSEENIRAVVKAPLMKPKIVNMKAKSIFHIGHRYEFSGRNYAIIPDKKGFSFRGEIKTEKASASYLGSGRFQKGVVPMYRSSKYVFPHAPQIYTSNTESVVSHGIINFGKTPKSFGSLAYVEPEMNVYKGNLMSSRFSWRSYNMISPNSKSVGVGQGNIIIKNMQPKFPKYKSSAGGVGRKLSTKTQKTSLFLKTSAANLNAMKVTASELAKTKTIPKFEISGTGVGSITGSYQRPKTKTSQTAQAKVKAETTQVVKTQVIQAQMPKVRVYPIISPMIKPQEKQKTKQRVFPLLKQSSYLVQRQRQATKQKQQQIQIPKMIQIQEETTKQKERTVIKTPPMIPNFEMPTFFRGFGFGFEKLSKQSGGFSFSIFGKKKEHQPKKYQPSITAKVLGISSFKAPKILTGLEIRPIIKSNHKKKTKKRIKKRRR